jgi:REP element-mobilizing transposase RayT
MSIRYKFWDSYATYFVTFAVVDWIDVFTRNDYRKIVVDSINYCVHNKGLIVHGWVLMTNHLHLLISRQNDNANSFSDIMRDMKKYTAMHLIKSIKENPQESRKEWMIDLFERAGEA